MKNRRRPKYELVLQLVKERRRVTLGTCQKKYPGISSGTFNKIMNALSKSSMVRKVSVGKRKLVYQKTDDYSIQKAKDFLKKHLQVEIGNRSEPEKKGRIPVNPLLTMSIYSLWNALESFHEGQERHRQSAIILMDLAVEYALKARVFQGDPVKFVLDSDQLDFFSCMREIRRNEGISKADEIKLTRIHNTRNYAQHRGVIPDSPSTRQYALWPKEFIQAFISKNFSVSLSEHIPKNLLDTI